VPEPRWHPPERPKLRTDLQCKKATQGTGAIFKVKAPESSSICLLHDVEIAVLKLMDGKRTLAEIAAKGAKGGLPMTQVQLEKFIRELVAYNFVQNADPLPPWSAQSFVELADDAIIGEPKTGEEQLFGSLAARVPEAAGPEEPGGWDALRASAQRTFERSGNWLWLQFQAVQLALRPVWRQKLKPLWLRAKKGRAAVWAAAGAGGLLLLLIVLAFVRVAIHETYACQLSSLQAVDVSVPCEAVIAEIAAREGQRVARGDVLALLDVEGLKAQLGALQSATEKGQQEILTMRKGTDPNAVDDERRQLQNEQRQLAALKKGKSAARTDLEQRVALIRRRLALMAAASQEGAIVRKEVETDGIRKARQLAEEALARPDIRAPIAGKIEKSLPESRAGTVAHPNELLARISAADRFLADAWVPESDAARIAPGAMVLFAPGKLQGSVLSVGKPEVPGSGREVKVQLELQDPGGVLTPGTRGGARIEIGRHSALAALFGR
jgi:multidrug efflux pump subunit AcrA (membrane-fusion protein)